MIQMQAKTVAQGWTMARINAIVLLATPFFPQRVVWVMRCHNLTYGQGMSLNGPPSKGDSR